MIKKIDPQMTDNMTLPSNKDQWINLDHPSLRGVASQYHFERLGSAPFVSKNVDVLSKHSSGINMMFETNSTHIKVKASLIGAAYMAHMTAVATVGFDLYVLKRGKWVFLATTKVNASEYEVTLLEGLTPIKRTYRLYFPLYQAVNSAYLGIDYKASYGFLKPEQEKIVIYGTSISQGGCASRPGLSYGSMLDRRLPYEVINLGFSGSAHMEEAMIDILKSIPKRWLILELEANNDTTIHEKISNFLNKIPDERVILMSHFPLSMSLLKPDIKKRLIRNRCAQQEASKNIIFIDGTRLLHKYGYDETVDGVHLNDIGFYAIANYLEKVINNDGK
ncbi:MAG: SGNH/GDSL hydrolase family protein [Bacilli bacterium]